MEETNVLLNSDEALQPLLQLAQESANSNISMIRTVVMKALSDPKVFCGFDQIKATLQQGALQQGAEGDPILRTLDLFSYGTYHDFHNATAGTYLTLSDAQVLKLRQLTLLTLVQKACSSSNSMGQKGSVVVPYQIMASELGFVTSAIEDGGKTLDQAVLRQVEDIALSCIYAGIVAGQLCQKTSALFVHSRHGPPCRHRDVPLSEVPAMLQTLQLFLKDNLEQTCWKQEQQHQTVQMQLDASRNYLKTVLDRKKKAENSSALGRGAGWAANAAADAVGGPPQERRLSDHNMGGNARRQSKRTRGSVSGGLEPSYRY